MIDPTDIKELSEKYDCQIEIMDVGTSAGTRRYVAVVRCSHKDYGMLTELEKEIRESLPDVDRVVLDITPPEGQR